MMATFPSQETISIGLGSHARHRVAQDHAAAFRVVPLAIGNALSVRNSPMKPLVTCNVIGYNDTMIVNIKHKGLADLYSEDQSKGVMQSHVKRLKIILAALETAGTIKDMDLSGLKLHMLSGDLKGFYAVSVSGNWRVIFHFVDGNALDVDYLDYH
jgi:toxin HigB-1